jgi:hypothetical protein
MRCGSSKLLDLLLACICLYYKAHSLGLRLATPWYFLVKDSMASTDAIRRVGQEVEFSVRGQRKRVKNEMREYFHRFHFVDEAPLTPPESGPGCCEYADNDVVVVSKSDDGPSHRLALEAAGGNDTEMFVIETIFIARERKLMEGWYVTPGDKPHLPWEVKGDAPVVLTCRQTVSKAVACEAVAETVGLVKKAREKHDKQATEDASRDKSLGKEKKKKRMPDFSKPSVFDGRRERGKKSPSASPTGAQPPSPMPGSEAPTSGGGWASMMVERLARASLVVFSCCVKQRGDTRKPSPAPESSNAKGMAPVDSASP